MKKHKEHDNDNKDLAHQRPGSVLVKHPVLLKDSRIRHLRLQKVISAISGSVMTVLIGRTFHDHIDNTAPGHIPRRLDLLPLPAVKQGPPDCLHSGKKRDEGLSHWQYSSDGRI